jgi:calmodulin
MMAQLPQQARPPSSLQEAISNLKAGVAADQRVKAGDAGAKADAVRSYRQALVKIDEISRSNAFPASTVQQLQSKAETARKRLAALSPPASPPNGAAAAATAEQQPPQPQPSSEPQPSPALAEAGRKEGWLKTKGFVGQKSGWQKQWCVLEDGALTFFQCEDAQTMFRRVDEDGSGMLDEDEVRGLCKIMGLKLGKKEVAAAMAQMDADGSGVVDFDEFEAWWSTSPVAASRAKERQPAGTMALHTLQSVQNLKEGGGCVFELVLKDSGAKLGPEYVGRIFKLQTMDKMEREPWRQAFLRQQVAIAQDTDSLGPSQMEPQAELAAESDDEDEDEDGDEGFAEAGRKEGWLKTKGFVGQKSGWQKQWCVLEDGALTFFQCEDAQTMFRRVDEDGSGMLDEDEVRGLCKIMGLKLGKKEVAAAMAQMDADGSGVVDFDEFEAWWSTSPVAASRAKAQESTTGDLDLSTLVSIECVNKTDIELVMSGAGGARAARVCDDVSVSWWWHAIACRRRWTLLQ